jgi:hypothetical protein
MGMSYMVQYISIDYSCTSIRFQSRNLWPFEVSWVIKFTLHCLGCNFLKKYLFDEQFTPLERSIRDILFELPFSSGFSVVKNAHKALKNVLQKDGVQMI